MKTVSVIIIDDIFLEDNINNIAIAQNSEFNFIVKYFGPVRTIISENTSSKQQYLKYKDYVSSLTEDDYVIIGLDLGFDDYNLINSEMDKLKQVFPQDDLKYKNMHIGLFFLIDLLDVIKCKFELLIASAHAKNDYFSSLIRNGLVSSKTFKSSITENGDLLRFGDTGFIRFLSGSLADPARALARIDESINYFVKDFDEVSWFLKPPKFNDEVDRWFPDVGGHKKGQHGFNVHLEAVIERYPHWCKDTEGVYAKALLYCSDNNLNTRKNRDFAKLVCIDCLKDFFGEDILIEGLNFKDLIAFPTEPAFPFLISVRELLREFKHAENRITLRLLAPKDSDNGCSVIALGVKADFSTKIWQLIENTWLDYIRRTTNQDVQIDEHQGDLIKKFSKAMTACVKEKNEEDKIKGQDLENALIGLDTFVAVPFFAKDFVGLSWETKIIHWDT